MDLADETLAWSFRISQTFCGPTTAAVWLTTSLSSFFFWLLQLVAARDSAAMPDRANARRFECIGGPLPVSDRNDDALHYDVAGALCQRCAFTGIAGRSDR